MTIKWKLGTILMWPACRYAYLTKSLLKADTGFRLILSCRSWGQGGRDPGNEVCKAALLSLFWRRDFDVFVLFLFSTVKSNSPKPTEEEEKEKAPQTEESEETEKEEDTKMEHWTLNISPFPSARIPPTDLPLPPIRPSFFLTPRLLPSSTVAYMHS